MITARPVARRQLGCGCPDRYVILGTDVGATRFSGFCGAQVPDDPGNQVRLTRWRTNPCPTPSRLATSMSTRPTSGSSLWRASSRRTGPSGRSTCWASYWIWRTRATWRFRSRRTRRTSTRSPRRRSHRIRVTASWSGASRASTGGTPWRWWSAPIGNTTDWAGISPPSPLRRRSTRWASTTSSRARGRTGRGTRFTSRGTLRRACMRGRFSKDGSPPSNSPTSDRSWPKAAGCRRTRIRGSCPASGSSPPCRWGWRRSWRSTRPGSTATLKTAA